MSNQIVLVSDNQAHLKTIKNWADQKQAQLLHVNNIHEGFKIIFEQKIRMVIIDVKNELQITFDRLMTFFNKMELPCVILTQDYSLYVKFNNLPSNIYIRSILYQGEDKLPVKVFEDYYNKANTGHKLQTRIKQANSKKKSPLIIALSLLMILEPILKLLYFKLTTDFAWADIFSNIIQVPIYNQFEFWLLFPIGGFALLGRSLWTFFFFSILVGIYIVRHLAYESFTWPYASDTPHFSSIALIVFGIIVVIYFVLPEGRKDLLNRSGSFLRKHPRYRFTKHCHIELESGELVENCQFHDISMGGALLSTPTPLFVGDKIKINIKDDFPLFAHVVRHANFNNIVSNGLEFEFISLSNRQKMKQLISQIEAKAQMS